MAPTTKLDLTVPRKRKWWNRWIFGLPLLLIFSVLIVVAANEFLTCVRLVEQYKRPNAKLLTNDYCPELMSRHPEYMYEPCERARRDLMTMSSGHCVTELTSQLLRFIAEIVGPWSYISGAATIVLYAYRMFR